jgi:hypothetical protein
MNKTVVCSVCHLYDVNVLGDTVLMMSNFFFQPSEMGSQLQIG